MSLGINVLLFVAAAVGGAINSVAGGGMDELIKKSSIKPQDGSDDG